MRTAAGPAGLWMIVAAVGLMAGTALQLQQATLWPTGWYAAAVAVSLGTAWVAGVALRLRPRWRVGMLTAWCLAWALGAFGATGWRAADRLAEALPAALEGRDLVVVGVIANLPQRAAQAWRFRFDVESALDEQTPVVVPSHLSLGWYANTGSGELPVLRAGQRWRLTVRLKQPHGTINPHGNDYELLLFEQGVRATGSVRTAGDAANQLQDEHAGHRIDRWRQGVRDAIAARVAARAATPDGPGIREAGVIAALAVGDQAAISREDWALYRHTGVAHLMSISGLHVTMFAWLAGLATAWGWRRSTRLMLRCPAPWAARWGGLAAALAYAVFAGWGVPAQRTVWMLATVTLLGAAGLRWSWPMVWGAAMVVVAAVDPWALLQPGFWLSFAAVGLLMASGEASGEASNEASNERAQSQRGLVAAGTGLAVPQRARVGGWLRRAGSLVGGGLRTQCVATLGLAPLTLVFFQQLSLVGFGANLLAIPVVTLCITPLALLGTLLPPLWLLAAWGVQVLNALLQGLAEPAWALWSVPAAAPWAVACALLGSALALLPLPWRVRALALPLVLPLFAPFVARPAVGEFELTAIDIGQGTAVLLRTARHTLLYDTGPQYSRESDAGERVVVPLLRALGEPRLDLLMLSHRDTDHVGGAAAVLKAVAVERVSSSLERGHPLLDAATRKGAQVGPCEASQRWEWDGVAFELLHPGADALARAEDVKIKPNTLSCVLRVQATAAGQGPRSVLLPGDLEREQELALVSQHGTALASDVLLVPHHGSKTSSSAPFLDAVAPRVAVVQAGYRNRFGHPAAPVTARYAERGIELITSPRCGAWQARMGSENGMRCWRAVARRYWHHPDIVAPQNGVEVANSGESESPEPAIP